MKSLLRNTFAGRGIYALLIIALAANFAFGQGFAINGSPTLNGSGTYSIKGNITNTAPVTFTGTVAVTMSGAAAQTLGSAGNGAITIPTLNINTTSNTTTAAVSTSVGTALTVATGSTYDIGATTLTLGGTSTLTGTGALNVSTAGSTVVYNGGSAQTILGLTYAGAVTLSGAGAKNLAGAASVAGTFTHSGGALTVDQNLTVSSATPSFAAIANVATTKALTLSGTGAKSITTVTNITGSGLIANTGATGLLTIGTLTDNTSTSNGITGGAAGVTFTSGATNHGIITGAGGAITFSSTLAQAGGTITAGAGGVTFTGGVTQTAGSLASAALANLLKFSGSYSNVGGGSLDLTSTGAAEFDGTVTAGTFNLASGSTVTYSGAAQAIADIGYGGNLIFTGGTKTWTLGAARTIGGNLTLNSGSAATLSGAFALNVTGNVSLSSNLTVAGSVAFAQASSAVSGTGFEIVGNVTRTHTFVASTAYTFNNAAMTVTPTTVGTLSSLTVQSNPSTSPTGYNAGNSVNRQYHVSYTGGTFTATMQLAYLAAEYSGSLANKLKDFNGSIAKTNKISGTYTAGGPTSGFMYVSLPGITTASFASGNEIGIDDRYNIFNSIATAVWNAGTTWDAGTIPTATDDAVITGTHTVTVADAATANALSVTIDGSAANTLVVGGGASGILNVGAGGLTNGSSGNTSGVLTVSTGANVNITGSNLATFGTITNNGTVTVN